MTHGTVSSYTNHDCRCEPCALAMREYRRGWQKKNREKVNAQARKRYADNPGRAIATVQRYQERHPERVKESNRTWRQANPEKTRAKNSRYRATLAAVSTVDFTTEQLQQKLDYYGNHCYLCGGEADTLDHVKPISKGGPHMLANLRPACVSCNSRKRDRWPYPPLAVAS